MMSIVSMMTTSTTHGIATTGLYKTTVRTISTKNRRLGSEDGARYAIDEGGS
jgi:hypothetical protein